MKCCCGKYELESETDVFVINDIMHKALLPGYPNFCGSVKRQRIAELEAELDFERCRNADAEKMLHSTYKAELADKTMTCIMCEGRKQTIAELEEAANRDVVNAIAELNDARSKIDELEAELEHVKAENKVLKQVIIDSASVAERNRLTIAKAKESD